MEPTRDISWDEAVQALRNTANRNNSTESKMSYRNINLVKYTSIGIGTSNNRVIWKRHPVPCVQIIYGLIKTFKGFSTVFEKLPGNSGKRSNIGQVCIALLIISAVIFTVLSPKRKLYLLAWLWVWGQTVECLCMQMGLVWNCRDPLVELWATNKLWATTCPSQALAGVKQNPPPVPASRLLNPTKHSFFSAKAQVPYSHCVALNAIGFGVPGPDFGVTRSLISPSKARKGMAPVVKLTWCPDQDQK